MQIVPDRFRPALDAVRSLAEHPRYRSAYVFGSVAEGTSNRHSDLDVCLVVDEDNPCPNLNHPDLWGYKLDLSFRSLRQVREMAEQQRAEGKRPPWLGSALILFDKTGGLVALQREVALQQRATASESERHFAEFIVYHSDDKVHRYAQEDPATALYSMHACIPELLEVHFLLNRQWWASSKNVLARLRIWDAPLADLVARFLGAGDLESKLTLWDSIVDRVLVSFGGRRPVSENSCTCHVCAADVAALAAAAGACTETGKR